MSDPKATARLNHGGSAPDNPLLEGMKGTLVLAKHNAGETLKQCWVAVGGEVFAKLTDLATETDYEIRVDFEVGVHLDVGTSGAKNVVHFTTEPQRHAKQTVYAAPQPQAMITLDGYDASDPEFPLIYPIYQAP